MDEKRKEKIRDGLRRAKARGGKIGNPILDKVRNSDLTSANRVRVLNSQAFALKMITALKQLISEGIKEEKEIVAELNKREIPARRGGEWSVTQYRQLWKIISALGYKGLNFKK